MIIKEVILYNCIPLADYQCFPFCIPALFNMTDILCVNETEAMIFAGYENATDAFDSDTEIKAVMEILLKKCPTVIITLGKKGAAYANRKDGPECFQKVDAPVLEKGENVSILR